MVLRKQDIHQRRPFFSMKDELRIGHCQNNNYRCNGCGISHDKAGLSKYSKYAAIYGEIRI